MPTYPSVEISFQRSMDNLSAYKKALIAATANRGQLWQIIDDANDETYENRVKGSQITDVDNNLDNTKFGNNISAFFTLHNDYFSLDAPIANVGTIDQAIAYYKWRVSEFFNFIYQEFTGTYLTTSNVFSRDDISLGTHARTGDVFTNGSAVNTTTASVSKIMAETTILIGASNYVVTATLQRADDSTIALPVTFTATAPSGTQRVFGETALSANAAASQPTVQVASTAAFAVGDTVLVEDTNNQEWGTILSMVTNTSITLTANLKQAYTTAASAKITPMFKDVTAATSSGTGTNGDACAFKVKGDRTLSLSYSHVAF